MALARCISSSPGCLSPILVRLADTLIGAAIAHLFSYVLAAMGMSEAPRIANRLLAQLAAVRGGGGQKRR